MEVNYAGLCELKEATVWLLRVLGFMDFRKKINPGIENKKERGLQKGNWCE